MVEDSDSHDEEEAREKKESDPVYPRRLHLAWARPLLLQEIFNPLLLHLDFQNLLKTMNPFQQKTRKS